MLKSTKEFLQPALTNNTFDSTITDRVLHKSLENSFSSLYRLQRNMIEYEEFFYTTQNNEGEPDFGDLFLNSVEKVCMNIPGDLIGITFREKFKASKYVGKAIPYETLKKEHNLIHRIPVILIDNHILHDFDVIIYDDYFTVILPVHKEFLYERKFNADKWNYNYIDHDIRVQLIQNTSYAEFTTNIPMLKRNSYDGNSLNRIQMVYLNTLKVELDKKHNGTYFAVIYKGDTNYGSSLQDVRFDDSGDLVIHLDDDVNDDLMSYSGKVKVQLIFFRNLFPYTSYKYDGTNWMDGAVSIREYNRKTTSDIMIVQKENNVNYNMPIPTENFIIFRSNPNEEDDGKFKSRTLISNKSLKINYPNIYRITSNANKGDKIRAYYFYAPGYNIHYNYLFDFYYRYLMYKWECPLEESINDIYYANIIDSEDPLIGERNTLALSVQASIMENEELINHDQVPIFYHYALENMDSEKDIEDIKNEFLGNIASIEDSFNEDLDEDGNTKTIPTVISDFTDIFEFIINHEITEYRFDEVDYLNNYQKTTPPLDYKVKKLKEFIKDNINILHDYVKMQNKVGIKYEFSAEECDLESRVRDYSEGSRIHFTEKMYVFGIAKPDPSQYLSARIFINGYLCTEFHYERYEYSDYIYIPVKLIPDDAYFEIEVYPAMERENNVVFTPENNSIEINYERDDIVPTLSDLFFYEGEYTVNKLPVDDFKVEILSDRYNYYMDLTSLVTLYSYTKDGKEIDGDYFDENGHSYSYEGQRQYKKDISVEKLNELIAKGTLIQSTGFLTSNLFEAIREKNVIRFDDIVSYDASLLDCENEGVIFSTLKKIKITCLNPDHFNKDITIRIAKHPYYFTHNAQRASFPRVIVYAENTDNIKEYTRVYMNGKLICQNRYDFDIYHDQLNVRTFERLKKGDAFTVDISPYRSRMVMYKECIVDDPENPDLDDLRVDLRGYINKPFDTRYYELFLNGRRLSQHQICPISPWEIKLAGCHSIYNLEVYEKDRDWEYYGLHDFDNYFTLSDLIRESFMKKEDIIRDRLIHDITGDMDPNTNDEEKEPWDRLHDMQSVQFEIFYYEEILPLKLGSPDKIQFNSEYVEDNYETIHNYFHKLNDKGESVYLLNPDIYYDPHTRPDKEPRWIAYMLGNRSLDDITENEGGE